MAENLTLPNVRPLPWLHPLWQRLTAPDAPAAHALLFIGPAGIGKRQLAEALAARILCEQPQDDGHACGQCPACRLHASGNHPDFFRIVPEGEQGEEAAGGEDGAPAAKKGSRQIVIEQIRQLQAALTNTGHQSERRPVLIDPLEAMNAYTANALLKLLEEPPAGCRFLLVCAAPARLLPTILSRCQCWRLAAPAPEDAAALLTGNEANALLALNGGAPLAAQRQSEQGWAPLMHRFVQEISALPQTGALTLAARWEAWLKQRDTVDAAFALPNLVDWLHRWVADLALLRLGADARFFPTERARLQRQAQHFPIATILTCYNDLAQIRHAASHPLNARLLLEDMLLRYARLAS